MRGGTAAKLAKNKVAVTSKRRGYETRVARYQGWFGDKNKGGKQTIAQLNAIMEEMTTMSCLATFRESTHSGYPITKIKIGPRGAKLRKIHARDNTRQQILVPDVKSNKRRATAAKNGAKKSAASSTSTRSRSKTASGKRKTASSTTTTSRSSSASSSSSSNRTKRQKNGKQGATSVTSALAIGDIMEVSSAAAAKATKKKKAKKRNATSDYNESSADSRIDSNRSMKNLKTQLEESLRAAIEGMDAGKSRKRKLHNLFSQTLLISICKMCPTELSHMDFFLDKGLRGHLNLKFGELIMATVNKFLMEHADIVLNGDFPKVSRRSVNAAHAEAMESSYFPASQGSASGVSPVVRHRTKSSEKKPSESADVNMFSDSDDDDFELANLPIPKSKTRVHDLT